MLKSFLLKTVLYFCAFAVGFFLFMPNAFAVDGADNSDTECDYLKSYLSVYRKNDIDQMLKLQTFLKEREGFNVKLSGVFDSSTMIAVREFQIRYSEDILKPWGLDKPTGNVSITTRHKINDLSCGIITPLSKTEKEIIQSYSAQSTDIDIDTNTETTDTVDVGIVDTKVHDITNIDIFKKESSEKLPETKIKTNVITPIITIDSLSEYLAASDAEVGSDESSSSTASSCMSQNNLAKNSGIAGIPVGFNSQFSLPILIVLAVLLLTQLCFFWKTSIDRKMRWVTKRF